MDNNMNEVQEVEEEILNLNNNIRNENYGVGQRSYANITLRHNNISVVIFLPKNSKLISNNNDDGTFSSSKMIENDNDDTNIFYSSSRFDHSSMIGDITIHNNNNEDNDNNDNTLLYGTDIWRQPHNSYWPESGMGIASEFGVGDDGSYCYFKCGWYEENDVTNGLLGYDDAMNGQSFLKIGVGELIKGSCPMCNAATGEYKFNSPYLFALQPKWNITIISYHNNTNNSPSASSTSSSNSHIINNKHYHIYSIRMDHEAILYKSNHEYDHYGYRISKLITLYSNNTLDVTTSLTNLGYKSFSTVWYSHNFFTCNHKSVGPGYSVNLNLQPQSSLQEQQHLPPTSPQQQQQQPIDPLYDEPGTWSWSTPLSKYARVTNDNINKYINIDMKRTLEPGIRIKAEFNRDIETNGDFTYNACQTKLISSLHIPNDIDNNNNERIMRMYSYNLYIEHGTLSPEPQLLIKSLQYNQTISWTQRLEIISQDDDTNYNIPLLLQPPQLLPMNHQKKMKRFNILSLFSSSFNLLGRRETISDDTITTTIYNNNNYYQEQQQNRIMYNMMISPYLFAVVTIFVVILITTKKHRIILHNHYHHRRRNGYETIPELSQ